MKPIDEMTPEEKSVLLAKLCGWIRPAGSGFNPGLWSIKVPGHQVWGFRQFCKSEPTVLDDFDLYDDRYMATAWRALNWAHDNLGHNQAFSLREVFSSFYPLHGWFAGIPPADAQRLLLDKILSLVEEKNSESGIRP